MQSVISTIVAVDHFHDRTLLRLNVRRDRALPLCATAWRGAGTEDFPPMQEGVGSLAS
jgi:hypothetical protein